MGAHKRWRSSALSVPFCEIVVFSQASETGDCTQDHAKGTQQVVRRIEGHETGRKLVARLHWERENESSVVWTI